MEEIPFLQRIWQSVRRGRAVTGLDTPDIREPVGGDQPEQYEPAEACQRDDWQDRASNTLPPCEWYENDEGAEPPFERHYPWHPRG